MNSDLISLAAAADLLGISSRSLRYAIRRGDLPALKIGRTWVVRRADVEAYRVQDRYLKP